MRKHEKCAYKPSIRQAISICKLILARFMNRGVCEDHDFIDIAVITSPIENQILARKVATDLLSFKDKPTFSKQEFASDIFGEVNTQDLVDDIGLSLSELDNIIDDFEFLNKFFDEIKDHDLEELFDDSLNDFFNRFSKELDDEPYKTAMDFIDQNGTDNFNRFNDLNDLLDYAKELLKTKINHLDPEDILTTQKLDLSDEILSKSTVAREKIMGEYLSKGKNNDALKKAMEKLFQENFYKGLDATEFALNSKLLDSNSQQNITDVIKKSLQRGTRNINDLFNASKTMGTNLNLDNKNIEKIMESSLKLPFKEAYHNSKNFDQYFGSSMTDRYLKKINENFDSFLSNQNAEQIKEELLNSPMKLPSWRKLLNNVIDKEVQSIDKDYEDQKLVNSQVKSFIDELIDNKNNTLDFSAQAQLSNKISDLVNDLVEKADDKENLGKLVKDFNNEGFLPKFESIKIAGERLKMPEDEILNLVQPNYEYLKRMIESNKGNYQTYKDMLKQMNLSNNQINQLVKAAVSGTSGPNLDALSALSEKNLAQVVNSAERLGSDALDMALSSLGAGSGLDLLEQWFYSRHNISANVKKKLKEILKQIMIDLGIRSANSLIGTAKSGPLVENIVIPYTLGDDFELIDLEETISNLLEGGKSVDMITNDDFLVSKTTDGLRCLVLELDISGSMSGQKLAQMALCATMLVYAFKPEELALTFFESNTHKLKDLNETVELEKLVDELLDIKARGGTCIHAALKWANLQFEKKARSKYKINVLFTDADIFDFKRSSTELNNLKEKDIRFVMVVPKFGFSPVMAKKMVKKANGVLLTLNQWRDFPKLISEILSDK
jgi:uncharacterized protein YegL